MKTSNKILLSIFIAVLLILTGIHVALTQKYKNGAFTVTTSEPKKDTIDLKPVKYVILKNIVNVVMVPSDSYQLEVDKNQASSFQYTVSGDTLMITGDSSTSSVDDRDSRRGSFGEVILHLPEMSLITAENSSLELEGRLDTARAADTHIELRGSMLLFRNQSNQGIVPRYFGDVFITAKQRSEVGLSPNKIYFDTLSFELEKSIFRDNEGDIKRLIIKADDSSLVQVSGRNLQKLK